MENSYQCTVITLSSLYKNESCDGRLRSNLFFWDLHRQPPLLTISLSITPSVQHSPEIFYQLSVGHAYRTQLDDVLCQSVDRPKYKLRLEEVSSAFHTRGKGCFPSFHEKGWVRVVSPENKPIYCSDKAKEGSNR